MSYYDQPWPGWLLPMFIAAIPLCLVGSVLMIRRPDRFSQRGPYHYYKGVVGLLLGVPLFGMLVVIGLSEPLPKLVLSKEGLYCAGWRTAVPWSEIKSISLLERKRLSGPDNQIMQVEITSEQAAERKTYVRNGRAILGCRLERLANVSGEQATLHARLQLILARAGRL